MNHVIAEESDRQDAAPSIARHPSSAVNAEHVEEHRISGFELVDPRGQQCLDRRRQRHASRIHVILVHRSGQLLDEERIALAGGEHASRRGGGQLGAAEEAARVGGIGSCGRELCCSTWLTSFTSVTTHVARKQQLSLNPQKLAGQCGKLKCCLNFEYDSYTDAQSDFPDTNLRLKTKKGDAMFQKMDVFKRLYWYTYINEPGSFMAVPVNKVKYIIDRNKAGKKPDDIETYMIKIPEKKKLNGIEEGDINRFDKK